MGNIEPGLFRQLNQAGETIEIEASTILTQEGVAPDSLWFLIEGELRLERRGQAAVGLNGSGFVGELAWLNRGISSASVIAQPGARLIRWNVPELRRKLRRNHRLELAFEALIAHYMARKLARSGPIQAVRDGAAPRSQQL
ncbi:MAG: cyclic nucleotide-binding domain-containing protein [Pararhodobacter sp.]|nr:cyclic nucleotide-binding domain-containing protein [Pararhodobacter sp.]